MSSRPECVLVHAPFGRDAEVIARVLATAGIAADICATVPALCRELAAAAAVLVADEALHAGNVELLSSVLDQQPPWSDLPVVVMTKGGETTAASRHRLHLLEPLGNLTLLERPLRTETLVSGLRTALRARRRQHQIREHLERERQAAEALRRSEERLTAALDGARMVAWEWDPTRDEVTCSATAREMLGLAPGQALRAADWHRLIHPDDLPAHQAAVQEAVARGTPYTNVCRFLRPDTHAVVWAEARGGARRNEAGQVTRLYGVLVDITERIVAEEALQESERQFQVLADSIPQLAWMAHADGHIFWYNERWYQYTGTTPESMKGWGWQSVHDPQELPRVIERWRASLDSGEPFDMVFPLRGADNLFRPFLTRVMPVRDSQGRVVRWFGTNTDISEQRSVEDALRQSEAQFRQTADAMPQLVWVTRPDGYHEWYNQRWYDYTGTTPEQSEGTGWNGFFHPDDRERAWQVWRRSLDTGQLYEVEYRCQRHDGVYRWFLGRAMPIYDEQGRIVRWFGTCTDIDEQKRTEVALQRSNEDLQQFAFAAAHDLQEPLRTVTSYTQLLARSIGPKLQDEDRTFMAFVLEAAGRMSELIRDLREFLEVSGEEEGGCVDLNVVLRKALNNLEAAIRESGASVTSAHLPAVRGKEVHFVQLLQNLISNAIKYRSNKPPEIQVAARRQNENWVVSVRDNGIGIAADYREQIFGLFKRLHGKNIPGTGIGLAICHKIVERQGGRIWVESEPGNGSTFLFTLPVHRSVT